MEVTVGRPKAAMWSQEGTLERMVALRWEMAFVRVARHASSWASMAQFTWIAGSYSQVRSSPYTEGGEGGG